eukprot:13895119-Heterocapsa_arctica.AAC.1
MHMGKIWAVSLMCTPFAHLAILGCVSGNVKQIVTIQARSPQFVTHFPKTLPRVVNWANELHMGKIWAVSFPCALHLPIWRFWAAFWEM